MWPKLKLHTPPTEPALDTHCKGKPDTQLNRLADNDMQYTSEAKILRSSSFKHPRVSVGNVWDLKRYSSTPVIGSTQKYDYIQGGFMFGVEKRCKQWACQVRGHKLQTPKQEYQTKICCFEMKYWIKPVPHIGKKGIINLSARCVVTPVSFVPTAACSTIYAPWRGLDKYTALRYLLSCVLSVSVLTRLLPQCLAGWPCQRCRRRRRRAGC